jgi:hypothetical protein
MTAHECIYVYPALRLNGEKMNKIQDFLKEREFTSKSLDITSTTKGKKYLCRLEYRVNGEGFQAKRVMVLSVNGVEAAHLDRDFTTGDQDETVDVTHLIDESGPNTITLEQFNIKLFGAESRSEFSLRRDGKTVVKESYDSDGAYIRATKDDWWI